MRVVRSVCGIVVVAIAVITAISARAQAPPGGGDADVQPVLDRLSITLPPGVVGREPVRQHLETLGRERCDQQAIIDLGEALDKLGYRREAASAHISFSEGCGGKVVSLRRATNLLLRINDHQAVITVAEDIIRLEPFDNNGYFLRAVGRDRKGETRAAIDDYLTAIELFPDKQKIASVSYVGMARNYAKLGQFCDAASAINSWVAINPANNDTGRMRSMISEYTTKGNCNTGTAGKDEVFAVPKGGNVVKVQAIINGVTGTFLIDTGATYVSLRREFALKAKVAIDTASSVRLNTANGIVSANRGRAGEVKLRSLVAKDVAIVVHAEGKGFTGADGLLGMSFLTRFKMTMDGQSVRISKR